MPHRYFTVEEADRTLPLVRRIVEDIVKDYRQWADRMHEYELVAAGSHSEAGESEEQVRHREELERTARHIDGYIEELAQIGCVFKGFDEGLVDFYSRMDGRDVFLCWKLGEPAVTHWHEIEAGFAGRRTLVPQTVAGEG